MVLGAGAAFVVQNLWRSSYTTRVGTVLPQPVPFSHQHHSGELGIDCRFCHSTVERAAAAGMPPTETCMTCHSQIWAGAPVLEPVRRSYASAVPLRWTRVYDLPGFAYFDHSIHVRKGIGCRNCHGAVDEMPLTYSAKDFSMQSCLECHREPERFVGARRDVFRGRGAPPSVEEGRALVRLYQIQTHQLADCSICHR
jgi:hypothetical protein